MQIVCFFFFFVLSILFGRIMESEWRKMIAVLGWSCPSWGKIMHNAHLFQMFPKNLCQINCVHTYKHKLTYKRTLQRITPLCFYCYVTSKPIHSCMSNDVRWLVCRAALIDSCQCNLTTYIIIYILWPKVKRVYSLLNSSKNTSFFRNLNQDFFLQFYWKVREKKWCAQNWQIDAQKSIPSFQHLAL